MNDDPLKKKTKKDIFSDPNLPTIHSLGGNHYEMEGREFSIDSCDRDSDRQDVD